MGEKYLQHFYAQGLWIFTFCTGNVANSWVNKQASHFSIQVEVACVTYFHQQRNLLRNTETVLKLRQIMPLKQR